MEIQKATISLDNGDYTGRNATFTGNVILGTGDNLYLNGTTGLRILHDGSNALFINQTAGDVKIQNSVSDKDIIFIGKDGGLFNNRFKVRYVRRWLCNF